MDVDVEEALDLDSTNTVFRTDALWRFTQNRRHRLDFTWFSFRRGGHRRLLEDIAIEDGDGNTVIIESGTTVDAFFNLGIYELTYSYSLKPSALEAFRSQISTVGVSLLSKPPETVVLLPAKGVRGKVEFIKRF